MTTVHTFAASLQWSNQESLDQWWNSIYREMWPNLSGVIRNKQNGRGQAYGVDTVIALPNGKTIAIDEKTRRREYPDIALEHTSVDKPYKPGWIEKDLIIDFLAYGFLETGRVYMFPWTLLQAAWRLHADTWKAAYRPAIADNGRYKSISTPVPVGVLMKAMIEVMFVSAPMSSQTLDLDKAYQ